MIGHSLGRMETCFGQSTQGAGIRYQNTFQMQILLVKGLDAISTRPCHGLSGGPYTCSGGPSELGSTRGRPTLSTREK